MRGAGAGGSYAMHGEHRKRGGEGGWEDVELGRGLEFDTGSGMGRGLEFVTGSGMGCIACLLRFEAKQVHLLGLQRPHRPLLIEKRWIETNRTIAQALPTGSGVGITMTRVPCVYVCVCGGGGGPKGKARTPKQRQQSKDGTDTPHGLHVLHCLSMQSHTIRNLSPGPEDAGL
jgi:hypothetical protein